MNVAEQTQVANQLYGRRRLKKLLRLSRSRMVFGVTGLLMGLLYARAYAASVAHDGMQTAVASSAFAFLFTGAAGLYVLVYGTFVHFRPEMLRDDETILEVSVWGVAGSVVHTLLSIFVTLFFYPGWWFVVILLLLVLLMYKMVHVESQEILALAEDDSDTSLSD